MNRVRNLLLKLPIGENLNLKVIRLHNGQFAVYPEGYIWDKDTPESSRPLGTGSTVQKALAALMGIEVEAWALF